MPSHDDGRKKTGRSRRRSTLSALSQGARQSVVVMEQRLHSNFMATLALCSAVLSMCYSLINVFPYSGFMAMQLIPTLTHETAGTYAGVLSSSFMAGRAISSFAWGAVADTYGRKFVLLFSLWNTIVFSLLFGLSPNFTWAMLTRFLMGLGNGIMVVARTSVSELAHGDREKEAKSMGMLMSVMGYGMLLGPAAGGALSEPLEQYPKASARWFPADDDKNSSNLKYLLATYPFVLPNVVACIICLLSVVFIALCVKETLPAEKKRGLQYVLPDFFAWLFRVQITVCRSICLRTGNINADGAPVVQEVDARSQQQQEEEEDELMILDHSDNTELSALLSSKASRKSYSSAMRRPSLICPQPQQLNNNNTNSKQYYDPPATIDSLMGSKVTREHLMAYWISSFAQVAQSEAFPLFAMANAGGLGLSEKEIGAIGTGAGLFFCIFQYIIFATMTKRLGLHRAMLYGSFWGNAPIVLFPVSLLLPRWAALPFLSVLMSVILIFNSVFYAGITVATNRTVCSSNRAKLNGLASMGASIGRGIGPLVAGVLVAVSLSSVVFPAKIGAVVIYVVLTAIAISSFTLTCRLPEENIPDLKIGTAEESEKLVLGEAETIALEKMAENGEVSRRMDTKSACVCCV
jgi:MFS family permease